MGWSIGYDAEHGRDIGYGVSAVCDHPGCGKKIHRGLDYACGGGRGGDVENCGLFFCESHMVYEPETEGFSNDPRCRRCADGKPPFLPTPDIREWLQHKLTDGSWVAWRAENPEEVDEIRAALASTAP